MDDDESGLPPAHPAFRAHFTDPLYDEEGDEFAPFGTDEGWDMVMEWADRTDELTPTSTVRDVLEDDALYEQALEELAQVPGEGEDPPDHVDVATIVVGAGFTLLRLAGRIDDEGRQLVLQALDSLSRFYAHAESDDLATMRADLASWSG